MHFNPNIARETIMNHYLKPKNKTKLDTSNVFYSTSCSDKLLVDLKWDQNILIDASFDGIGCAPFLAGADMFLDAVKGKTKEQIDLLVDIFTKFVNGENISDEHMDLLGDLWVFYNIKSQPNRIHCTLMITKAFKDV
ncbi:iron-sulfur cluster assembly scaffold protein [Mycoplasma sp. 394]